MAWNTTKIENVNLGGRFGMNVSKLTGGTLEGDYEMKEKRIRMALSGLIVNDRKVSYDDRINKFSAVVTLKGFKEGMKYIMMLETKTSVLRVGKIDIEAGIEMAVEEGMVNVGNLVSGTSTKKDIKGDYMYKGSKLRVGENMIVHEGEDLPFTVINDFARVVEIEKEKVVMVHDTEFNALQIIKLKAETELEKYFKVGGKL